MIASPCLFGPGLLGLGSGLCSLSRVPSLLCFSGCQPGRISGPLCFLRKLLGLNLLLLRLDQRGARLVAGLRDVVRRRTGTVRFRTHNGLDDEKGESDPG